MSQRKAAAIPTDFVFRHHNHIDIHLQALSCRAPYITASVERRLAAHSDNFLFSRFCAEGLYMRGAK